MGGIVLGDSPRGDGSPRGYDDGHRALFGEAGRSFRPITAPERGRIQEIFSTLDTAERARMVLGEYAQMKLSESEESGGDETA